ncbi:MAG: helix-turn-helix domain-containing protein [Cyclobacteriaceae bacterium]
MAKPDEKRRIIFGIKLREARENSGYSLKKLGGLCSISPSYLNEIEKGKKYPSTEKVNSIAEHLKVDVDWLLSEKLDKKLAPVSDLLESGILKELPLAMLGLELPKLLELLSNTPSKLNAFIRTLIEITRNYNLRVETFYFSVMRSYQEIHDNYFESLEAHAERFLKKHKFNLSNPITSDMLAKVLKRDFDYTIVKDGFSSDPHLADLRSYVKKGKTRITLFLNKDLSESQKAFIYGREIGYCYMNLEARSYTSTWVEISSFEEVLNNFRASYFSNAIFLHKTQFLKDLKSFLSNPNWNEEVLFTTLTRYNCTPEMLLQRLTNLLPKHFGLKELFFLRFTNVPGTQQYELSKEMHLGGIRDPRGTVLQEHYCRRWMFIDILDRMAERQRSGTYRNEVMGGGQIATYFDSKDSYLVFSIARPLFPTPHVNSSLTLGIKLDAKTKAKIAFVKDASIRSRLVHNTCERCPAQNCKHRSAKPTVWLENEKLRKRKELLKKL